MSFLLFKKGDTKAGGGEVRVFLPGWGFDGRSAHLFPALEGEILIVPAGQASPRMTVKLDSYLQEVGLHRIKLIGWSMGANLALDFAANQREKVSSLTLAAMRSSWPAADIQAIREGLLADPPRFMADFYRKCFLGSRTIYERFVAELQESYLEDLDLGVLLEGLDYLEHYRLVPGLSLPEAGIMVLHGERDIVAPVAERPRLAGAWEMLYPRLGHAVLSGDGIPL